MIINFNYYQIFYYVAETQNISAAANQMYISQPTVSRAIQALEQSLGCTLMTRSKQGIKLTEEGLFLYEYVKKAFANISFAESHFQNTHDLNQASLSIGSTEYVFKRFLLPYIVELEKEFPGIQLSVNTFISGKTQLEMLNNGRMDISIFMSPTPLMDDPSIITNPLAAFPCALIAPPERIDLLNKTISFKDLEQEPFIGWIDATSGQLYMNTVFQKYHMSVLPKYTVCSSTAVVSMVENNLGFGIIPKASADEAVKNGRVLAVSLEEPLPYRQIIAMTSKNFPHHPVRDLFLKRILDS